MTATLGSGLPYIYSNHSGCGCWFQSGKWARWVMTKLLLVNDVIVPSVGVKKEGDILTSEEAGVSYNWLLANRIAREITDEEAQVIIDERVAALLEPDNESGAEDQGSQEVTEGAENNQNGSHVDLESTTTSDQKPNGEVVKTEQHPDPAVRQAELIDQCRKLLADGKMQPATIADRLGISKEQAGLLLTEQNGFLKNQQGWYSLVAEKPESSPAQPPAT